MNNVLCIGELLIDFICTDKGNSLTDGENFVKKCGGAPFNASIAIKKLGANAIMCGSVGIDSFGDSLISELEKYEVSCENVKRLEKNTTLAFVSLDKFGERDFIFNRGADEDFKTCFINTSDLEKCNTFHFGSATAFLGGDLGCTYDEILDYALENNKTIIFDPNYRKDLFQNKKDLFINKSKKFISKADIVKLSDEEAFILTGEKDMKKAGKHITNIGAKYVLITLGKEGTLVVSNKKTKHITTKPVNMIDSTGAGDAFIGTIVAKVSNNGCKSFDELLEYVELGNKVGAMVVQKLGAIEAIPYLSEVE